MPAPGHHPKAPPHSLNNQRILTEALALVDQHGLEGLTTRALGRRLGVDPTAIYRHFRNKNELLGALADRIVAASQPPASSDGDASLPGRLRAGFLALHQALLAHPAMTALVARRPFLGGNSAAVSEHALGLLRQAGLRDPDAARAYQTLLFYTLGHALLQSPYTAAGPQQAAAELAASRLTLASLPASRYPNTTAVASHLYQPLDQQFTYGLDRLLDGLGLGAGDRPATTASPPSSSA